VDLKISQTSSRKYPDRTEINAKSSGLTLAIAIDFDSPGEKLTKRLADPNYLAVHIDDDPLEAARELYKQLRARNARTLNVAGNSIVTFKEYGWTQEMINERTFAIIAKVHEHWTLEYVRSGGQTGTDMAGGIAGVALGIPTEMTFPKGLLQRYEFGKDKEHTEQEIIDQVVEGVAALQKNGMDVIPPKAVKKRHGPGM
jgi:hypothetical protein